MTRAHLPGSSYTRLLSRRDVTRLLDPETCRVAVEEAFRQHGAGEAPPPGVLAVPAEGGGFHIKAGTLQGIRRYFAAKVNGNFSGNERLGLPRIQGVIVLCDAEDGSVLAVMDSSEITQLRTAAATAVAARELARPGSKAVTIVGCGVQGRAQLRALARVLPLTRAFAFDEREERAREFAADPFGRTRVSGLGSSRPRGGAGRERRVRHVHPFEGAASLQRAHPARDVRRRRRRRQRGETGRSTAGCSPPRPS